MLVMSSAAMLSAVQGSLRLSLSGSNLPGLHSVYVKGTPGPGLGRSHSAAWSLRSPNTLHASGWVGSKNGKDGLVSFWSVCV